MIIADEMSMIGANMLYDIHKRLSEIKFGCTEPFGGLGFLLVGDLMQLKPVRAKPVYDKPNNIKSAILWDSSDNLFNSCEAVVLKVNKRQGENNPWTDCLNRIRTTPSGELLPKEDLDLLFSRKTLNFCKNFDEAAHVFYTNKAVDSYNYKKLYQLPHPIVSIRAEKSGGPDGYKPEITDTGLIADTPFKDVLDIKIGSKVMIVFNISIIDSLVNGQMGTIIDIIYLSLIHI